MSAYWGGVNSAPLFAQELTPVEFDFYEEGVYSGYNTSQESDGVTISYYGYNLAWEDYACIDINVGSSRRFTITSGSPIRRVVLTRNTMNGGSYMSTLRASVGTLTPNGSNEAVWEGNTTSLEFTNSQNSVYIGHLIVYFEGSLEVTAADITYTSLHKSPAKNYTSLASDVLSFAKNVSIYDAEKHAEDEAGNEVGVAVDAKNLNLTFSPALTPGNHTVTFPEGMIKVGNNFNNQFSVSYTVTEVTAADMNPSSSKADQEYYTLSDDVLTFDGEVSIFNPALRVQFDGSNAEAYPYGSSLQVYFTETKVAGAHRLVIPAGMLQVGDYYNNEITINYNVASVASADFSYTSARLTQPEPLYSMNQDVLTFDGSVSVYDNNLSATFDGEDIYTNVSGTRLIAYLNSTTEVVGNHTLVVPAGKLIKGGELNNEIRVNYTIVAKPALAELNPTSQNAGRADMFAISSDVLTFSGAVSIFDSNMQATIDGNYANVSVDGNNLNVSFSEISTVGAHTLTIPAGMLQVGSNRNNAINVVYTLVKDPNAPDIVFVYSGYANSTATSQVINGVTSTFKLYSYNGGYWPNIYGKNDDTYCMVFSSDQNIVKIELVGHTNVTIKLDEGGGDFRYGYPVSTWTGKSKRVRFGGTGWDDYFAKEARVWLQPVGNYSANVAQGIEHGSVVAEPNSQLNEGDIVTLTATPESGYELASWTVLGATTGTPIAVSDNKFVMPAEDVTVSATFSARQAYTVTVSGAIENGTVTATPSSAYAGDEVVLSATPASGYYLTAWNVTDASSNTVAVTNNTFTMPASNVTVSATFSELPTDVDPVVINCMTGSPDGQSFGPWVSVETDFNFYSGYGTYFQNYSSYVGTITIASPLPIAAVHFHLDGNSNTYSNGMYTTVGGTAQYVDRNNYTFTYESGTNNATINTVGYGTFLISSITVEFKQPDPEIADLTYTSANESGSWEAISSDVLTFDDDVTIYNNELHATINGGNATLTPNGHSLNVSFAEIGLRGSYTLTIPEGMLRVDNNLNEEISVTYNVTGPQYATFDFATNKDQIVQGVSATYAAQGGAYIVKSADGITTEVLVFNSAKAITKIQFTDLSFDWGEAIAASTGNFEPATYTWTGPATSVTFSKSGTGGSTITSARVWVNEGFDEVSAENLDYTSTNENSELESISSDVLTFDGAVSVYNQQGGNSSAYRATINGTTATLTANGSQVTATFPAIIVESTPELVIPAGMLRVGDHYNNEIRVSYNVTGAEFQNPTSGWMFKPGYPNSLSADELRFQANVSVLNQNLITFDGMPFSNFGYFSENGTNVLAVYFNSTITAFGVHTLHFGAGAVETGGLLNTEFDVVYDIQKVTGAVAAPTSQNAGSVRELSEDVLTFAGNVAWDSSIKIIFGKTGEEKEVTPAIDGATLTFSGLDEIATESGNYHLVIPAQAIGVDGTYNNAAIEINYSLSLPQYKPAVHFDLSSGIPGPKNFVSVSGMTNLYNGLADLQWGNLVVSSLGNNTIAKVIFYGSNGMDQILATMGTFTSASATTATWVDNDTPVTSVRFTSDGDIYVGAIDVILYDENPEDELMNGSVTVQSLPYTCAFDDASTGKAYDVNGDGTGFVYDAEGFAKIKATGSANDYLVVAGFNLTAGVHYTASADVKAIGGTQTANLALGTSATDMSTFTQNLLYLTTANTEWENKSVAEFTVSATGTYYLAVKCTYGSGEFDVDNVHIAEAGTKMPMAVDDLEVTPDAMGALSATIAFTMPTTNYDGEPYGDGDRLTYSIYRNELVFFSGQAAPGDKVNVTDETAPAGNNTYSVIISDGSNGDSRAANANAYIGQDVPRAPQNVHITNIDGNNITVAWDDVTEDIHGQSIAPKYNVYVDGVKHNAELIEETEYTFEYDLNAGAQRDVRFSVSAENATGESSATSTSESLLAGAADALPYSLPFAESGNPYYDKDAGTGHCDIVDNTLMMSSFRVSSATVEVTTGKISFNDDATLTFYYKSNQSGNVLKVSVITSDGGEDDIILNEKLSETDGFVSQSLDLSDYKSCSWIRIKITSVFDVENQYFYIKNLTVKYEPKYTEQTLNLVGHNSDGYWATFSNANDVFFTTQTSVYTISLDGETLVRSNEFEYGSIVVDDETIYGYFVPAETGVLVNTGEEASVPYYTITHGEVADFAGTNYLRAASVAMEATGYKFYKFAYGDNINKTKLGFWWGAEGGAPFKAKDGGAYLAIPVSQASAIRGFSFDEQGFGTYINAVESLDENTGVYTLDGRKVSNDQKLRKGTYIVNGKKIVNF